MPEDFGFMQVDWEARIDFDRLRKDRVKKAQEAVAASEADILFVFRTEDARYLTSYRHHQGPSVVIGNATVVLTANDPPILFTMERKPRIAWIGMSSLQG